MEQKEDNIINKYRKTKEETIQEKLTEIEQSKNKQETLKKILKQERRTIIHIIDIILMTTLLILVITLQINGYYQQPKITIDCQGQYITKLNDQTMINYTIEDFNNEQKQKGNPTIKLDTKNSP